MWYQHHYRWGSCFNLCQCLHAVFLNWDHCIYQWIKFKPIIHVKFKKSYSYMHAHVKGNVCVCAHTYMPTYNGILTMLRSLCTLAKFSLSEGNYIVYSYLREETRALMEHSMCMIMILQLINLLVRKLKLLLVLKGTKYH